MDWSRIRTAAARACFFGSLVFWLCGCGAVTERVAGWYITRKLDSYLDFRGAQKQAARAQVDACIEELRRREMQAWVSFLREVRQGIHDGLTLESVARLQRHYDARLDAGVALLSPHVAVILVDLSPEQLDHFAARMREDLDEHFSERKLPEPKRRAAIEKRGLAVVEDLAGDLSDQQEDAVRRIIRSLPDERPAQYRSGLENVAHFRSFMEGSPNTGAIEAELRRMWEHRYDGLGPGRDKSTRRAWQRDALFEVASLFDAEQRAHAEDQLTERIRLLKRFMLAD